MKRAVIIHCWGGHPGYCWYPDTRRELQAAGYAVAVPAMPDSEHPRLQQWLSALQQAAGQPDHGIALIGHSAGCITILRYLETLGAGERVGSVVLVAGFTDDLGYQELKSFFATPIDFPKIRVRAERFVAIHSDNDPYVPLRYGEILHRELNAELIVKPGAFCKLKYG